jgi:hypothetical protein
MCRLPLFGAIKVEIMRTMPEWFAGLQEAGAIP